MTFLLTILVAGNLLQASEFTVSVETAGDKEVVTVCDETKCKKYVVEMPVSEEKLDEIAQTF